MKNANTMARKRRLISAASGSGAGNGNGMGAEEEEEEEEMESDLEEEEEDEEDDDDMGSSSGAIGAPSMQVDTHESSPVADDSNGGMPRRKSTRVTNAAAVIKLRTQDVAAHHSPPPAGGRGGAGKRAAPASSSAAPVTAGSNGSYGASSTQSTTNAKAKATGAAGTAAGAAGRKGAGSPPAAATNAAAYPNASAFGSTSSTGTTVNNNPPPRPPSTLSALPGQHYGMHPSVAAAYGAYGAPSMYGAPGFRADIFNSPEEAAQFYKAVKMYERETDRTKVLMSIKEYFLPHRSIEEISNMVDMAFPTFDPNASYNAALHPMYAQGRMYYSSSDTSGHSQLAGFSSGNAMHASSAHQSNQQAAAVAAVIAASQGGNGGKMDPAAAAYLQSNPALLGGYPGFPGMSMDSGEADFGPAPTHIEPSSLASITDRMSEQMKSEDGSASQGPGAQRQSGPGGSDHSSTASSSATVNGPGAGDAGVVKKKEDDDDLMSELASLTDRSIGGGGMSGFLGGRPLALSPGVFGGGSGSTPLGFGMTPLGLPNSTPLSFMSPLGLNFATQSPINPYFNPQK